MKDKELRDGHEWFKVKETKEWMHSVFCDKCKKHYEETGEYEDEE